MTVSFSTPVLVYLTLHDGLSPPLSILLFYGYKDVR